jgi:hypothetical protein
MIKKSTTILLAFIACITFAKAQITKNSVLLGGQIYYQDLKYDYSGITPANQQVKSATFNVSVGKAFKENSVFGVNLAYVPVLYTNYYNQGVPVDLDSKQYNIGIFNRQYKRLAKDFYFFAESGIGYSNIKQVYNDSDGVKQGSLKQWGAQLNLTPGISYRIWNKLHLEITIPNVILVQYLNTTDKSGSVPALEKSFVFSTSLNSTVLSNVGVGFHLIL